MINLADIWKIMFAIQKRMQLYAFFFGALVLHLVLILTWNNKIANVISFVLFAGIAVTIVGSLAIAENPELMQEMLKKLGGKLEAE